MQKKKVIDKQMKKNLRNTFLGMFAVVAMMAIIFNFKISLAYSHDDKQEANIILWPIKQVMELLVYKGFGMSSTSHWSSTLSFFLTEVPYVFTLITMFSYAFNFARSFSTEQEISEWIKTTGGFTGRVMGSIMGFVSPFCSCSTIPIMTSLAKSRAPFGTVVSFLITSPMINESGIALMWSFFGYKVSLIYIAFGFVAGILGSYIADWLKLQDSFKIEIGPKVEDNSGIPKMKIRNSFSRMHRIAKKEMFKTIKSVWWILILALAIGSIMHGWIPAEWIKDKVGNAWWAPLALIPFGMLMYLNISATLPIVNSFVKSGLHIGSALGFTMAVNTISLPEIIMLTKIFKRKFMIFFIIYLLVMILIFSYTLLAIPASALLV